MNVSDDQLGLLVATIIGANRETFIADIEPSECKNDLIKKAIREIKEIE